MIEVLYGFEPLDVDEISREIGLKQAIDAYEDRVIDHTLPTPKIVEALEALRLSKPIFFYEHLGTGKSHTIAFIREALEDKESLEIRLKRRKKRLIEASKPFEEAERYAYKVERSLSRISSARLDYEILMLRPREILSEEPLYNIILSKLGEEAKDHLEAIERLRGYRLVILIDELQKRYVESAADIDKDLEFLKEFPKLESVLILSANKLIGREEVNEKLSRLYEALKRHHGYEIVETKLRQVMRLYLLDRDPEAASFIPEIASIEHLERLIKRSGKENLIRNFFRYGLSTIELYLRMPKKISYVFSGIFPASALEGIMLRGGKDITSVLRTLRSVSDERFEGEERYKARSILKALVINDDREYREKTIKKRFEEGVESILKSLASTGLVTIVKDRVKLVPIRALVDEKLARLLAAPSEEAFKIGLSVIRETLEKEVKDLEELAMERAESLLEEKTKTSYATFQVQIDEEPHDMFRVAIEIDLKTLRSDIGSKFKEIVAKEAKRAEKDDQRFVRPEDVGRAFYNAMQSKLKEIESYVKISTPDGKYTLEEYNKKLTKLAAERKSALESLIEKLEDGAYSINDIRKRLSLEVPDYVLTQLLKKIKRKRLRLEGSTVIINRERDPRKEAKRKFFDGIKRPSVKKIRKKLEECLKEFDEEICEEALEGYLEENKIRYAVLLGKKIEVKEPEIELEDKYKLLDEESAREKITSKLSQEIFNRLSKRLKEEALGEEEVREAIRSLLEELYSGPEELVEGVEEAVLERLSSYKKKITDQVIYGDVTPGNKTMTVNLGGKTIRIRGREDKLLRLLDRIKSIARNEGLDIEERCFYMPRILGLKDGVPNFIRLSRYATILSDFSPSGQADTYPYKRRAKRSEGAMLALVMAMSLSEDVEIPRESVSKKIREKLEKIYYSIGSSMLGIKEKEKFLEIASEALGMLRLYHSRRGIEEVKLLEPFGGYGVFSRLALTLGIPVLYNELNPVAFFFFRTTVKGLPEGLEEKARELLEYLEEECSRYYKEDVYITFRARLLKCPHCGEHIPFIAGSEKEYYAITRSIDKNEKKTYTVSLSKIGSYEDLFGRDIRISEGKGSKKFFCPVCGRTIQISDRSGNRRKDYYAPKLDPDIEVFDFRLEDLPRAYAIPIADTKYHGEVSEAYLEGIEESIEDLLDEFDEVVKYVPYERIPDRSIDKKPHGIPELASIANYRTQLMTPRQILCYYKLMKRIDENTSDAIKDRLVSIAIKRLPSNVLTRTTNYERAKDILGIQSIHTPKFPVEVRIPGVEAGGGTLKIALEEVKKYAQVVHGKTSLGKLAIRLDTGFPVVEEPRPPGFRDGKPEVVIINEAAQRLSSLGLYEEFDGAFIDPPYLNMIPYRDLSYLYYARLKKIYGEKLPGARYKLDEVYELDLTKDSLEEFVKAFREALKSISELLKPEGFAVLQFAPPKSFNALDELRASVMAAGIEAELYPVLAASVLIEKSKQRAASGEGVSRTLFILMLKEEALEEYLEKLGLEGLRIVYKKGSYGSKKDVEDRIKLLVDAGKLDALIEAIIKEGIYPRPSEAIAISATLAAAITAKLAHARFEDYKEIIKNVLSYIASALLYRTIKETFVGIEDLISIIRDPEDLSGIYSLGLYYGFLDLQLLALALESAKKALDSGVFRSKSKERREKAPAVYYPQYLYEIKKNLGKYRRAMPMLTELFLSEKIIPKGETVRRFYRFLQKALKEYSKLIEERIKNKENREKEKLVIKELLLRLEEILEG